MTIEAGTGASRQTVNINGRHTQERDRERESEREDIGFGRSAQNTKMPQHFGSPGITGYENAATRWPPRPCGASAGAPAFIVIDRRRRRRLQQMPRAACARAPSG